MSLVGSLLFNLIFYLSVFPITSLIILLYPFLSTQKLQKIGACWIKFVLYLLRALCGITWKVEGLSNLTKKPFILVSNHQGQWESLFIQTLCIPNTSIIKKELLFIPFFGWALACMKPITLNRSNRFSSLKKVISTGIIKIKEGYTVILFPEGTRNSPEKGIQPFANSCGLLSVKSGAPIIPICHNSGKFWKNKKFVKSSGEVVIRIGKPMSGTNAKDLTDKAYKWIKTNYDEIV